MRPSTALLKYSKAWFIPSPVILRCSGNIFSVTSNANSKIVQFEQDLTNKLKTINNLKIQNNELESQLSNNKNELQSTKTNLQNKMKSIEQKCMCRDAYDERL